MNWVRFMLIALGLAGAGCRLPWLESPPQAGAAAALAPWTEQTAMVFDD